jgi:CubicO group peptidase (beta-lactamase class C family)
MLSYQDYVGEHIFTPAGMTATGISPYRPVDVPNMAHGYMQVDENGDPVPREAAKDPGGQSGSLRDNADVPQIANPSGGAYSTAADLLNFAQAVSSHRLLGKALTDTVLAGKVDSAKPGGPPNEKYAYGFSDASINGVRIVGHNGGTPGYEAQLDIYPSRGYIVVLLANQDRVLVPAIQRSEEMLTR